MLYEECKLRILLRAMRPFAKAHPLAHFCCNRAMRLTRCASISRPGHGHWQQHTPVTTSSTMSVWLYVGDLSHTSEVGLSSRRACNKSSTGVRWERAESSPALQHTIGGLAAGPRRVPRLLALVTSVALTGSNEASVRLKARHAAPHRITAYVFGLL